MSEELRPHRVIITAVFQEPLAVGDILVVEIRHSPLSAPIITDDLGNTWMFARCDPQPIYPKQWEGLGFDPKPNRGIRYTTWMAQVASYGRRDVITGSDTALGVPPVARDLMALVCNHYTWKEQAEAYN